MGFQSTPVGFCPMGFCLRELLFYNQITQWWYHDITLLEKTLFKRIRTPEVKGSIT